jgi:prenyltransferase beta subunit
MQKLINSVAFALLFFVGSQVYSDEPPNTPSGMALDKTLELFKGWSQRKAFPDSVSFAYYMAYSFQTLGAKIDPDTSNKLVKFISASQQKDGGFISNPSYGTKSNVIYTYNALKTLTLLGALEAIDRERAIVFISSLVQDDGSIKPAVAEDARATLASTYYGAASLHLLGKLDALENSKTAAYVLEHQTSADGFGMKPMGAASPQATFMGVRTLALVNGLNKDIKTGAIQYLEGAIDMIGMKGAHYRNYSTMQAVTYIVAALSELDALDEINTDRIEHYLESRYVPENGGFGPSPGLGTTPPSTYQAVFCLNKLGKLGLHEKGTGEENKSTSTLYLK